MHASKSIMLRIAVRLLMGQALLIFLASDALWSQNLLKHGGFNIPATGVPPGMIVSVNGCNQPGSSAAANWFVYINGCGEVTTTLVPSTDPNGKAYMMHVTASVENAGIDQSGTFNVASTLTWVSVYINNGCVKMGTGNGGSTGLDEATCETGRWFHFARVPNGNSPANEIVIYAFMGPADFYVEKAVVEASAAQPVGPAQ